MKLTLSPALKLATSVILASCLAGTLAASPGTARADETYGPKRPGTKVSHAVLGPEATSGLPNSRVSTSAVPTAEEVAAQRRLNDFRARAGLPAVTVSATPGALLNHAKYLHANRNVVGLDPYAEDPALPYYTDNGALIAPRTEAASAGIGTYSQVIDFLMSDPQGQYYNLLNAQTSNIAFARHGSIVVVVFNTSDALPRRTTPVVMPNGARFPLTSMPASMASWVTKNCAQTSAQWGFPITVQFDDNYALARTTSASLTVNGAAVPFCIASEVDNLGSQAQVVLVPTKPLPLGAHVAGRVEANLLEGAEAPTTATGSATIDFTTGMGPKRTAGDQTGDGVGDLLSVRTDGSLWLNQGVKPGKVGHGWQIGRGWQPFTWFSHTADVTGDGREDIIGRRDDGHLYLYAGVGMAGYSAGRKIGQNWNGLSLLTVVGDMTGDGRPEVVGVGNSGADKGKLFRYTLGTNGLTGKTQIGQNWNGITHLLGIGDFDGNGTGDLIAVTSTGELRAYLTGKGVIARQIMIGRGWQGFNAVFSPGDLTGDGLPDLVGRDASGRLYSYENRRGGFGAKVLAGTGFSDVRLFG